MAITPGQAGKITEAEIATVERMEAAIDGLLKDGNQGSGAVRITAGLSGLSKRCRQEVLRRFRAAGWAIKKERTSGDIRDPRDRPSDYWMFRAGADLPSTAPYQTDYDFCALKQRDQVSPPPWDNMSGA